METTVAARKQWGAGPEFFMSCMAMSVGLGNIWRFPYVCYENGGGAFLVPYLIVLIIICIPVYYMEMVLGQFSSVGNVKTFQTLIPALRGVGYGQVIGNSCVATYYASLMATTLFYLMNSFAETLPWAECKDEWKAELDLLNITCVPANQKGNGTALKNANYKSSSELYFTKNVLKEKTNIDNGIGMPEWRLSLCLLLTWAITFVVSRNGVSSSGKAAYFLAIFPYVIMTSLLVRAVTLEGSTDGIIFFIKPQWDKLLSPIVWYSAVVQCFFSLNAGFGILIMYSSYNKFYHNINRDAILITTLDTITSLLAGSTIFGILGNLAHVLKVEVKDVLNSGGPGLAFISYPDAIAKFDSLAWLFAILFFIMMFVLGLGSLVANQTLVNTMILDTYPHLTNWHVSAVTAILGFTIGLIYVTPGGQFMVTLVDHFGVTFIIFIFASTEVVIVMWFYGLEYICIDLEFMLKQKVSVYWRITWGLFAPVFLIFIFIYFLFEMKRLQHADRDYPDVVIAIGWSIVAFSIVQMLIWMAYYLILNRSYGRRKMVEMSFTTENWAPADAALHEEYNQFKEQRLQELKWNERTFCKKYVGSLLRR